MTDFIDKIALLDIKDHKILMAKSKTKDAWFVPGGKREGTETDEQALMREIREELSVDIVPNSINYHGTFTAQAYGKPIGTMVRLTCYTAEYNGIPSPSAEIEAIGYQGYDQRNFQTPVSILLFDDLKQKKLIN